MYTNFLTLEDLPIVYREIALSIGLDKFIVLCKDFGGSSIYIPTERKLILPLRNKFIKDDFNGFNFKELARKYDICETQVRKILHK